MLKNKIDIICPLYNAEKFIINLNNSLLKQKDVSINKIYYMLTESKDNTENILKENNIDYELVKVNEFSHSLTREKNALISKAQVLVFITQDIIIEKDNFLYELTKPIFDGEVQASFARQLCNNNSIEKYTRELNYPNYDYVNTKDDIEKKGLRTFFFSDAASAIDMDVFKKLNGYDHKNLPINEDMYIAYKLITNGYKIKYCSKAEVIHSHDFKLKEIYNRYKLIGKFFKENSYLDKFGTNKSGGGMAKYVLKRSIQDKNIKVICNFIPNMTSRFMGMKVGKKNG